LRRRLLDERDDTGAARIVRSPVPRPVTAWRIASLMLPQLAALRSVPRDAAFLHATQFPDMKLFAWLDRRTDVRPVFFVHDLLPLRYPQFFTEQNARWHTQFLDVLVRYGRAAIVNTETVRAQVEAFLRGRGVAANILVAPMPAAPVFANPSAPDAALRAHPYFVICGTIEPRKNHMVLLKAWQELVRQDGKAAPTLVIIGRRGWNNDDVFALLDKAEAETSRIVEVSGLTSNAMREIVANARALLIPSHDEGYGLPLVEALAAGAPVIASDIPVFREVGGARVAYCPAEEAGAWVAAVRQHMTRAAAPAPMTQEQNRAAWAAYFRAISDFVRSL
jgi:glycosyltransferase involved in cell wall biosynthesis